MTARSPKTPNILALDAKPVTKGNTQFAAAPGWMRELAQGIIESAEEHRHLKKARILLLVKTSSADAKKFEKQQTKPSRMSLGHPKMASATEKMLANIGAKGDQRPDFVVCVNGAWLDAIGITEPDSLGQKVLPAETAPPIEKLRGLLDHELCHCGVTVAGQFIAPQEVEIFRKGLGDRHLETRQDVTDEEGNWLIRYMASDDAGVLKFKIRPHEIEEFPGVVRRHGAWSESLADLVDVIEERKEKGLFDQKDEAA